MSQSKLIPGSLFYHRVYNELIIVCASGPSLYEHHAIIYVYGHQTTLYTSVSTSYLSSCIKLNNVKNIHPGISISKSNL